MKFIVTAAIVLVVAIAALAPRAAPHVSVIAGAARVIDGDTIVVTGRHVRLHGIDAPEIDQPCTTAAGQTWPCGREARTALIRILGDKPVSCTITDKDRYGRPVGICIAGQTDIGAEMVRTGMAIAYRRYSARYVDDEKVARMMKRGMWAGTFTEPEAWRHTREGKR